MSDNTTPFSALGYRKMVAEFGKPVREVRTKDGSLIAQWHLPKGWEVRVYATDGAVKRRDSAMDEGSSTRWFNGAVKQHGGAK